MLWASVVELAGKTSMEPGVALQLTGTPILEAELSLSATCQPQATGPPAATYSVGLTAVTVRTRAAALNVSVTVPALPVATSVTVPAACGAMVVEAVPVASVTRVQVAAAHAPKTAAPPVALNVML